MAHKGNQEVPPGYMDGVSVKISEKYKPPPRINLAVSYSQRLSLNNQIRDNIYPYDFSLETNVKERVKELKNARNVIDEEKKDRTEKIQKARKKFEDKIAKKCESANNSDKTVDLSLENKGCNTEDKHLVQVSQVLNVSDPSTANTSSVLYPMYSNILTPTPLVNPSQNYVCKANDKSPFNISDFEADTSSPFDNMELKTINDIEELAQVLKREDPVNTYSYTSQMYNNYTSSSIPNNPSISTNYAGQKTNANMQYYNIPQYTTTQAVYGPSAVTTLYSNMNGYYYSPEFVQANHNFSTYTCNSSKSNSSSDSTPPLTSIEESKKKFKSIPDIMKALEAELDNTHIAKVPNNIPLENHVSVISSPHASAENDHNAPVNELEDPYECLPSKLQCLSKTISSMGFPLPRVARVCQVLGDDHKKIVEHLLVMSQLLDLGFSEKDVSRALLQCNNDRDKALDILIS